MPDPYRKLNPGDQLKAIPAVFWNKLVDLIRWYDQRVLASSTGGDFLPRRTSMLKIKNNSGTDLGRFGVLGIDSFLFGRDANVPEFNREAALKGSTPTDGSHDGLFAVVLEPLADGKIGDCVIDGVVPVKLNIVNADHTFADIKDGDTSQLETVSQGSAQIIKKDGGGDWALVRLGNGPPRDRGEDCPTSFSAMKDFTELNGYDESKKQGLFHDANSACLEWKEIKQCS